LFERARQYSALERFEQRLQSAALGLGMEKQDMGYSRDGMALFYNTGTKALVYTNKLLPVTLEIIMGESPVDAYSSLHSAKTTDSFFFERRLRKAYSRLQKHARMLFDEEAAAYLGIRELFPLAQEALSVEDSVKSCIRQIIEREQEPDILHPGGGQYIILPPKWKERVKISIWTQFKFGRSSKNIYK
jgi:hypothetical protein